MPRILILSLCLLLSSLMFGCDQSAPSQKIGIVNINRILVDSEPGRQAAKYIETLQDKLREEATDLQKKAQALAEKEKQEGSKVTEEEKEELQKDIQMGYLRLQNKLQAEQQNVNSILNDVVHRVVEKYRRDNGYTLIIFSDVALSFEKEIDVTSGITKAMDQEKVEFKPLPETAPEPQAAAPEAKKPETKTEAKPEASASPAKDDGAKKEAPAKKD